MYSYNGVIKNYILTNDWTASDRHAVNIWKIKYVVNIIYSTDNAISAPKWGKQFNWNGPEKYYRGQIDDDNSSKLTSLNRSHSWAISSVSHTFTLNVSLSLERSIKSTPLQWSFLRNSA